MDDAREVRTWPEDEADAPGRLGVVEAFVNTRDLEAGTDVFEDPTRLGRWLSRHGLLAPRERIEEESDLRRAHDLREALRDVLEANHDGDAPPAGARAVIDREAARTPLVLRYDPPANARLVPGAGGMDRAVGIILTIMYDAMRDGSWQRLKVCRSDECRWAFYDASRNRSGKWCEMAVCGNREKARAFRERHGGGEHV